jgi:hypothetical protein
MSKSKQVLKSRINRPDPSRTIEGLRDTGYEFPVAIADLVDNSIAAEATKVVIEIGLDFQGNVDLAVSDNGCGMDSAGLFNAMRYGSPKRDDPSSLGKFGMGLKTASTAFSRRLTVTTRESSEAEILSAVWDLDHVRDTHEWELLMPPPSEEDISRLESVSESGCGTVVTWGMVDRLLPDYAVPSGRPAHRAIQKKIKQLKLHLSMVYQRFLDVSNQDVDNVEIFINDERLDPWDPFVENESDLVGGPETIVVQDENGNEMGSFTVRAFVLPRKVNFSTDEAAQNARINNAHQGIYVYRENRMIHGPDWMGIFQKEPHGTLLRVEFSFDHKLDEAFRIDIKKSRISLNESLYNWLADKFLPGPRRAADDRYRKGRSSQAHKKAAQGPHDPSNRAIGNKKDEIDAAGVKVIDEKTGQVEVTNEHGVTTTTLQLVSSTRKGEVHVKPVDGIDEGLLWSPTIIDQQNGVLINTSHPYYQKVYVPNLASGVTIQGMDSLLWALSVAELKAVSASSKAHLDGLRYEVSRILKQLVVELPEPTDLDD